MSATLASSARAVVLKAITKTAMKLPVDVAGKLGRRITEVADSIDPNAPAGTIASYLNVAGHLFKAKALERRMASVEDLARAGRFAEAARLYKELIGLQPMVSMVYEAGAKFAKSGEMSDAFTKAAIDVIETPELREMMLSLLRSPAVFHPSRLWLYFTSYNAFQIETAGIEHFKKTVNHNYFNWTSDYDIELQSRSLQMTLRFSDAELEAITREIDAPDSTRPVGFSPKKWGLYGKFLALLWELASRSDRLGLLERCSEPEVGDPLFIRYKGRPITQDLCNSVIDVNTMLRGSLECLPPSARVAEIGAGHGRIENVLLRARPGIRVAILDIPPALFVSQWYLSRLFPDKRIFKFRDFKNYEEIRAEFEASDIAFFLPSQAPLLPPDTFDAFVNICSLQEMTTAQIEIWFLQIDRLCRGWFYSKQFKESQNPFDGIVVRKDDYPVRPHWRRIFDRENPGNTSLFEVLYDVKGRA